MRRRDGRAEVLYLQHSGLSQRLDRRWFWEHRRRDRVQHSFLCAFSSHSQFVQLKRAVCPSRPVFLLLRKSEMIGNPDCREYRNGETKGAMNTTTGSLSGLHPGSMVFMWPSPWATEGFAGAQKRRLQQFQNAGARGQGGTRTSRARRQE